MLWRRAASGGFDHHAPVGPLARGLGDDTGLVRQGHVHHAPFGSGHGLQFHRHAALAHARRGGVGVLAEAVVAPALVAAHVHVHADPVVHVAVHHGVDHELERGERAAVAADYAPGVAAVDLGLDLLVA